jgi:tripartite ATP-independent transporter DctP family solute receptor
MKRYTRWGVSAVASLTLAIGALAQPAAAESWKFALEEIDGSVQDAYAKAFKKRIEEKSGGEVTVNIYPYGTLGTSTQLTELAANGAIQFANASPGHLGKLIPEIQVLSIPYLLSQNNECNKQILGGSEIIYENLDEKFENQGLKLLTMYPEGQMVWTTNKKITSPEDFSNFKIRVMTSPLLVRAYEAFGANPTPMPYSEVYSGLQLGQIDGQVNPIFAIEEMKFYEVQDYMIWAGQQQFTTTVVANYGFYDGLSDEHRQLVDSTVDEMVDVIFKTQDQYNKERLEKIKQTSDIEMIHLNEEQRAVFAERAKQVEKKFVEMTGDSGEKVLNALQQEIKTCEEKMGS